MGDQTTPNWTDGSHLSFKSFRSTGYLWWLTWCHWSLSTFTALTLTNTSLEWCKYTLITKEELRAWKPSYRLPNLSFLKLNSTTAAWLMFSLKSLTLEPLFILILENRLSISSQISAKITERTRRSSEERAVLSISRQTWLTQRSSSQEMPALSSFPSLIAFLTLFSETRDASFTF